MNATTEWDLKPVRQSSTFSKLAQVGHQLPTTCGVPQIHDGHLVNVDAVDDSVTSGHIMFSLWQAPDGFKTSDIPRNVRLPAEVSEDYSR